MLTLKPTDLGAGKLKDDYEVLDESRRSRSHHASPASAGRAALVLDDNRALPKHAP